MEIIKENGKVKAKVVLNDRYGDELLIMTNGHQWTGGPMNENLACQVIDALNEYLTVLKEKRDESKDVVVNQCDGCRAGLPLDKYGTHQDGQMFGIDCTKHLYD